VIPVEFCGDLWRQKTIVPGLSCGVVCVILCLAVLVELRLVSDRHGQTDTGPWLVSRRGNERLFLLLTLLGVCRAAPVQRSGGRPSAVLRVCCCAPRGQEISIDYCCTSGAQQQRRRSKCEQCHVDSRRRKLNADSLVRQRATLLPNF